MSKYILHTTLSLSFALMLVTVGGEIKAEGSTQIKLGYTLADEEGSYAVNQETFNTYEGFGLSISNFQYYTPQGYSFNADLDNVTLNNRNLRFGSYKAGLYSLAVANNRYRRFYRADGANFTRRDQTSFRADLTPVKHLKLFGGYDRTDKKGENFEILTPVLDTLYYRTDYTQYAYNYGGQVFCPYGNLRFEYRNLIYQDDLDLTFDREADQFEFSAFTTVPGYRWINLAGGYIYRKDKMDEQPPELKTTQGWGAAKVYLPRQLTFDYRLTLATSERHDNYSADNTVHQISATKAWRSFGGIRAGYENRTAEDGLDKTSSSGYFLNGWATISQRLHLKGKVSVRNKTVDQGATLLGDEDQTRHQLSATYELTNWGSFGGKFEGRVRENKDIDSRVDYTRLTSLLNLKSPRYGGLHFAYSYYSGKYENRSDDVGFEFRDHAIETGFMPPSLGLLTVEGSIVYYRSKRDTDLEKFNLNLGLGYEFIKEHHLEVRYHAYTFDDFTIVNDYYTGNIVEISLTKDLKL